MRTSLKCLHTVILVTVSVQRFSVLFCSSALCKLEKKYVLQSCCDLTLCSANAQRLRKPNASKVNQICPCLCHLKKSFHRRNFKCFKNIITLNKKLVSEAQQKTKSLNLEHKKLVQTKAVALSITCYFFQRLLLNGFIRSLLQQSSSWSSPQLYKVDTRGRWPYL